MQTVHCINSINSAWRLFSLKKIPQNEYLDFVFGNCQISFIICTIVVGNWGTLAFVVDENWFQTVVAAMLCLAKIILYNNIGILGVQICTERFTVRRIQKVINFFTEKKRHCSDHRLPTGWARSDVSKDAFSTGQIVKISNSDCDYGPSSKKLATDNL